MSKHIKCASLSLATLWLLLSNIAAPFSGTDVNCCGAAFAAETKDALYYIRQASACRERKDYKAGLEHTNKAIQLSPKIGDLYGLRAYFKFRTGDNAGALKDAAEGIRLDPKAAEIYEIRAGIYLMLKNFPLALKDAQTMVTLDPKLADGYLIRATANAAMDKIDEAAIDLRKTLSIDPNDSSAPKLAVLLSVLFCGRAQDNFAAGKVQDAIKDCDEAINWNPDNAEATELKAKLTDSAKPTTK